MSAPRLVVVEAGSTPPVDDFGRAVREGLTASEKRVPCRFFYDREGSRLFQEICTLPEYYLPRAEREILEAHGGEIASLAPPDADLVELGSGNASKTRLLLAALLGRQGRLLYLPIDIAREVLEESGAALLAEHPRLSVLAVHGEYGEGLRRLAREGPSPRLVLWLGSNVGNFSRDGAAAFLGGVRATLSPGDRLLLGVDLRKDRATLEAAYDDARGVTARFNLNLLARINRELGGRFDLAAFRHRAIYEEDAGRVRMFLVSERAQRVAIEGLDLEVAFEAGETIHTEDSTKYSPAEIRALAAASGFRAARDWTDAAGRFSEVLLAPS